MYLQNTQLNDLYLAGVQESWTIIEEKTTPDDTVYPDPTQIKGYKNELSMKTIKKC